MRFRILILSFFFLGCIPVSKKRLSSYEKKEITSKSKKLLKAYNIRCDSLYSYYFDSVLKDKINIVSFHTLSKKRTNICVLSYDDVELQIYLYTFRDSIQLTKELIYKSKKFKFDNFLQILNFSCFSESKEPVPALTKEVYLIQNRELTNFLIEGDNNYIKIPESRREEAYKFSNFYLYVTEGL